MAGNPEWGALPASTDQLVRLKYPSAPPDFRAAFIFAFPKQLLLDVML